MLINPKIRIKIRIICVINHSALPTVNRKYKIAARLCNSIQQIPTQVSFCQIKSFRQFIAIL
jgi:hypothetical protein